MPLSRPKSPFKRSRPNVEEPSPPLPTRPDLKHYQSTPVFGKDKTPSRVASSNAFAQNMARASNPNSEPSPDSPMTSFGDIMESVKPMPEQASNTGKDSKKKPEPLRLVPINSAYAVPTQLAGIEDKKRRSDLESRITFAQDSTDEQYNRGRARDQPTHGIEKLRPKSPGKSLWQKVQSSFAFTSSEALPTDLPAQPTPAKAARVLGEESLGRAQGKKKKKKRDDPMGELDFACRGIPPPPPPPPPMPPRSRSTTMTSTAASSMIQSSSPVTPSFNTPIEREIRSVGGPFRHATRVPTIAMQRAVSDTATIEHMVSSPAPGHASDDFFQRTRLHYMNESLPPTPPSKDAGGSQKARRPQGLKLRPMPTGGLEDEDEVSSPPSAGLARLRGNEYLGAPSALYTYRPDSPTLPQSAGPLSPSFGSALDMDNLNSTSAQWGRRWSDGPLIVSNRKERSTGLQVPGLLAPNAHLAPAFYSPVDFTAPADWSYMQLRPSGNSDPSLFYLPQQHVQVAPVSQTPSHVKPALPTSSNSFTSVPSPDGDPVKKDRAKTPSRIPHRPGRFVIKKRPSYNVVTAPKPRETRGLGLSPMLNEALGQASPVTPNKTLSNGPQSAIPQPLQVQRATSPNSMDGSLPAAETLDGLLALHLHVDQSTDSVHKLFNYNNDQIMEALAQKHAEMVKIYDDQVADIINKINGVEELNNATKETLNAWKAELTERMNYLINMLEEQMVKPMGQLIEGNLQLEKSVNHLITRIIELEKKQKELQDSVTSTRYNDRSHNIPPNMTSTPPSTAGQGCNQRNPTYQSSFNPTTSYDPSHSSGGGGNPMYPNTYQTSYNDHYQAPAAYPAAQWGGNIVESRVRGMSREQRAEYMNTYGRHVAPGMGNVHPTNGNNDKDGHGAHSA